MEISVILEMMGKLIVRMGLNLRISVLKILAAAILVISFKNYLEEQPKVIKTTAFLAVALKAHLQALAALQHNSPWTLMQI